MVCNNKYIASLYPSLVPLLFLLHSLTRHGFTILCDGVCCQLVSPTCRCGSLVQASAGCEIGHLTFAHELCMAPLSAQTLTQAQICHYDLKLTFMVWPPCVLGERGKGVIQIILQTGIKTILTSMVYITLHVLRYQKIFKSFDSFYF